MLAVLLTAPLGALATSLLGPVLLNKSGNDSEYDITQKGINAPATGDHEDEGNKLLVIS